MSFTQILDDARGVDRIEVIREVINFGRQMGFTRSTVVDAADHCRMIATSAGMGVSLGDVPDGYDAVDNPPIPVEDSPDMPRLHEVFGAAKSDDGFYRLPVLTKEFSALHIGPIHIVFDMTAHDLATELAGTDRIQAENWYVMFVKPGLVGPFRCEGEAIPSRSGRINVNLTLFDEGREDRTITSVPVHTALFT